MSARASIVMPFYNEEANVERVVSELLAATRASDWAVELVCVQNGSRDRTGEILDGIAAKCREVAVAVVPVNRGYGYGIRQGFLVASGEILGYLDGDGQVRPGDVLRVLDGMKTHRAAKAVRCARQDGSQRRLVSGIYNLLFRLLFRVGARDANAKPKFLRRADLDRLALVADDWFIDAEILIKTKALGIDWAEEPVEFMQRRGGTSKVRLATIREFLANLWSWRMGRGYRTWKRTALRS